MANRTLADQIGPEAADKLARLAIDMALYPPARIDRYTNVPRVHKALIEETREVLTSAGIDWKAVKERSG